MIKNRIFRRKAILFFGISVFIFFKSNAAENDLFALSPEQVSATLDTYFKKAESDLESGKIRDARQGISLIEFKILKYKKTISNEEKKNYEVKITGIKTAIKQKIDSLINVNLAIIKKSGRNAGNEYRQFLSAQQGLSESELAIVDDAIMQSPVSEEEYKPVQQPSAPVENQPVSSVQPPVSQPHVSVSPAQPSVSQTQPVVSPKQPPVSQTQPSVSPKQPPVSQTQPSIPAEKPVQPLIVKETPKPISSEPLVAQTPAKPLEIFREKPAPESKEEQPQINYNEEFEKNRVKAMATAAKIRALLEDNKTDEAKTVFQIYQVNMSRFLEAKTFSDLKTTVESRVAKEKGDKARMWEVFLKINKLLDQNKAAEAYGTLKGERENLKKYIDEKDYKDLETRTFRAQSDYNRVQSTAHTVMAEIKADIKDKKIEQAYKVFEKNNPVLEDGLTNDELAELKKEVVASQSDFKDKKKLAEIGKKDILTLIHDKKGNEAEARFNDNRVLLKEYLFEKDFEALAADVEKAKSNYAADRVRALKTLDRIDSLLGKGKVQAAKDLFDATSARVKTDCANDKRFFETKERLDLAYGLLRAQKMQAEETSRKIDFLIVKKEGKKAYELFLQEESRLKEFLDNAGFDKIKQAALKAKNEYDKNVANAQATVKRIEGLLNLNKTEQAFSAFKDAEDDLYTYYEDEKYLQILQKKTRNAYDDLQNKKQKAESVVKDIRRLVEKDKGREALDEFQKTKPDLSKYLDAKTVSALEILVKKAGAKFAGYKAKMEQQAGHIRTLITQKKIEDAYDAFDSLETQLRTYLDENTFTSLKTTVEKFNNALLDNKKEAMKIIGSVNRFIDKNQGDSAYILFMQRDPYLSKYCAPKTYTAVLGRAAHAKAEFEKNCKIALDISAKLKAMIAKDNPEGAYGLYDDKKDFLEHYMDNVTFKRTQTLVFVPYDFFMDKRKQARSGVAMLKRMIGQDKCVEAKTEFLSRDKDLTKYLPKKEYDDIRDKVYVAYDKTINGRKEANQTATKIRALLADDKIAEAYKAFKDAKSILETYLSKNEYTGLQSEVISTYDEQEDKRKQVKDYAQKLRQMVSHNKLWDAYKGFTMNKKTLNDYLDAETYADLEKTVIGTYNKAREKSGN